MQFVYLYANLYSAYRFRVGPRCFPVQVGVEEHLMRTEPKSKALLFYHRFHLTSPGENHKHTYAETY